MKSKFLYNSQKKHLIKQLQYIKIKKKKTPTKKPQTNQLRLKQKSAKTKLRCTSANCFLRNTTIKDSLLQIQPASLYMN